ncbi:MAG: DUF4832 domain-containing protein [Butyrivibrio sp.]|uniref:DUF4832 domain-containing protein n=1 Tax=Butyrivibrio sp. TaxID=28121 RepID=UPI001B071DD0|nr:DUF4832 domain-containing protein [Butyrivibrio sp.]MBO6240267.1 DUF4832 domain-containing protein [Butyrivibrio sp.]
MRKIKLIPLLITLLAAMVLVGACYMFFCFGKGKVYTYKADEGVYPNPYVGFAPDCDSVQLCSDSTLVYMNIKWRDLEPLEGVYDWDKIESEGHLYDYRALGKHLVLRFVCDYPGEEEHMDIPDWLYEKTRDGEFYEIEYGCGYCPDYNNEDFISAHENVLNEIGRHFSDDDFLSYVELGSLGHWGEWHTYYPAGIPKMPLEETRRIYVKQYAKAFPYARLLMRRPFAEMPEEFGVFNDMTGAEEDTNTWLEWIEQGGIYNETKEENGLRSAKDIWNIAPVGGEFTSSIPMSTMLGSDLDKTLELLEKSHMSFIGPMVPECNRAGDVTEGIQEVLKRVGYRYRVSSFSMKNAGFGTTEITVTMVNDGVAPVYFDLMPYIYIEDENGNLLEKHLISIDLKKLCQDREEQFSVKISGDMLKESGTKIYVGIEEPGEDEPSVYLTMQAEREETKSLLWSK